MKLFMSCISQQKHKLSANIVDEQEFRGHI